MSGLTKRQKAIEEYIRGLEWGEDTDDYTITLVCGNIRGFVGWLDKYDQDHINEYLRFEVQKREEKNWVQDYVEYGVRDNELDQWVALFFDKCDNAEQRANSLCNELNEIEKNKIPKWQWVCTEGENDSNLLVGKIIMPNGEYAGYDDVIKALNDDSRAHINYQLVAYMREDSAFLKKYGN
jgi:hypothetical protein